MSDLPFFHKSDSQKSLLLRYAVVHDFEVEQMYVDDNYSGTDTTRPAFRQMIRDAEARRFDVILVNPASPVTWRNRSSTCTASSPNGASGWLP